MSKMNEIILPADPGSVSYGSALRSNLGSKRSLRIGLSFLLCLLMLSCKMEVSTTESTDSDSERKVGSIEGIENTVFRYDEGLYRGGDIVSQNGMDELKKLGIKTVFSVTPTDDERKFALKSGIKLIETPFTKDGIPQDKLPLYLDQMKAAEQPFYVHCHSGKNRGGTLLAAYRIHVQDWPFSKVRTEFVSLGGKADEFPALLESVKKK